MPSLAAMTLIRASRDSFSTLSQGFADHIVRPKSVIIAALGLISVISVFASSRLT